MKLFDVYPVNPIEIVRAAGSKVWDSQDNEYLDMYGGHAVISIGHTHPHYVSRLSRQLEKIGFYSNSVEIPQQAELAELLGVLSGKNDYQLFLCNSGAEANENALKLASFYNKRGKVVAFSGAFHGRTSLAVACTDNPKIQAEVNHHQVVRLPFNDSEALEQLFSQQGDSVSSVILESIQGVGGIREASPEFLQCIRRLTSQHGAVFIADEVQCGYGRSGRFFAQDISGVQADVYTMAKGMGNGFPVGGLLISPDFQAQHGMLGTTFGGNHLACAAALAVLEVLQKEQLIEQAARHGAYLKKELQALPHVQQVRGTGLMIGIQLPAELSHLRKDLLFKDRVFTGEAKGNIIRLLPSLAISQAEIDYFLEVFSRRLKQG